MQDLLVVVHLARKEVRVDAVNDQILQLAGRPQVQRLQEIRVLKRLPSA